MDPANLSQGETQAFSALAEEGRKRLMAWLSLPPGDRAELLRGRIVYKAMASIEHGDAVVGLAGQLDRFRGPPGPRGGGWWLSQDVDMVLSGQGLRPDMVGWRHDRHPRIPQKVNIGEKHLGVYVTPPDWVCEVLSPSTRIRDEDDGVKWQAYHEAGVEHYWLVDLDREQITVYRRNERRYEPIEVVGAEAIKPLPPFEAIAFEAQRIFLMVQARRAGL